MLFGAAKLAFSAGKTVYGAASAIRHPIQAVQDAIRDMLVKVVVKSVVALAGDHLVTELTTRVDKEKRFDAQVRIPEKMRAMVLDAESLSFTTDLVNTALSVPLGALGLTLGALAIHQAEDGESLAIRGVFKLASASASGRMVDELSAGTNKSTTTRAAARAEQHGGSMVPMVQGNGGHGLLLNIPAPGSDGEK